MAEQGERSATLSVCCLTRGPTARVAAQLQLLRPLADEIVVALDSSVDEDLAHPLEEVADVLVRYPYREPVDRPVGWVHSLCTRAWIFWVDDDEVPSTTLLREIPHVIRADDVTHGFVPRRTPWRDARTLLAEYPWSSDYQLRLVKNDPRLLWFPGITHWPIQAVGPHCYLESPLYHTDLLLNPLERRRAKVQRYESAVPGRRVAGLPMNAAFFLPEARPDLGTVPVPVEDAGELERLLALEPWPRPKPLSSTLRLATPEEIDAHWHGEPPDGDTYQASLTIVDALATMAADEKRDVTLRVENRGNRVWPWGELGSPQVRVSYRWLTSEGEVVVGDGLRTPLPHTLTPGASGLVAVDVLAPDRAGRFVLELDLVHEHVRWFGNAITLPVEVRPLSRVAVLGATEDEAADAAALLTETAPTVLPILLAREPEETSARLGYEAVDNAASYLLADASHNRLAARAQLLRRVAALQADALLVRAGRRPHLAHRAAPFIEALSDVDALLVLDGSARSRVRRERLHRDAAVLAARLLGVPVVHAKDAGGVRTVAENLVTVARSGA